MAEKPPQAARWTRSSVLAACFVTVFVLSGLVYLMNRGFRTEVEQSNSEPLASFPAPNPANQAQVSLGQGIYAEQCASCHGQNLEGEPDWRSPRSDGTLPAPPHNEDGHTWHHPDNLLFHITKFGGAAVAPEGFISRMPAFGDSLTDEEISATLAYIKSRWPQEVQLRQRQITAKSTQ
ncbi:c-type cytochrome [Kiloniella laminariae]|uniref:C-type cytochrome n=1 Tax=Kiloniella laminariae TaxID=454162 RepID=A0ABT4LNC0_9PROT|nr:c-type cytochrome [Kiloniella laminariae]MCZ4281442.1 c-type cytochrome [Kiloniella laminariae]